MQLDSENNNNLCLSLEFVFHLLETDKKFFAGGESPIFNALDSLGFTVKLEQLQTHPSQDVYKKAFHIIKEFFDTNNEDLI